MRTTLLTTLMASVCFLAGPAAAQTLRIALASEPTAVDPHYHDVSPNNALAAHVFDGLILGAILGPPIVRPAK